MPEQNNKSAIKTSNNAFDREYAEGLFDRLVAKGRFSESKREAFIEKVSTPEGLNDWFDNMVAKGRYAESKRSELIAKMYPTPKGVPYANVPGRSSVTDQFEVARDAAKNAQERRDAEQKRLEDFTSKALSEYNIDNTLGLQERIQRNQSFLDSIDDELNKHFGNKDLKEDFEKYIKNPEKYRKKQQEGLVSAYDLNRNVQLAKLQEHKKTLVEDTRKQQTAYFDQKISELNDLYGAAHLKRGYNLLNSTDERKQHLQSIAENMPDEVAADIVKNSSLVIDALKNLQRAKRKASLNNDASAFSKFISGVVTGFDGGAGLTLGLSGLSEAIHTKGALRRMQEGKGTTTDRIIVNSLLDRMGAEELYQPGTAGQIGQGAYDSLEFMLDMAITGGIGGAAIKGIKTGTKALAKTAAKQVTKEVAESAGKQFAKKIGKDLAASAVGSVVSPMMYNEAVRRQNENYMFGRDENGEITVKETADPESLAESFGWALLSNNISRVVERGVGPVLEKGMQALAKPLAKITPQWVKFGNNFLSNLGRNVKDLMSVQGFLPEYGEEFVEELLTRALVGQTAREEELGAGKWDDLFSPEWCKVTFGSVAVIQAAMGLPGFSASTANAAANASRMRKHMKNLPDNIRLDVRRISAMEDDNQRAQALSELLKRSTDLQRVDIMGYMTARAANNLGVSFRRAEAQQQEAESYRQTLLAAAMDGENLLIATDRNGNRFAVKPTDGQDTWSIGFPIVGNEEDGTLQIGKPQQMDLSALDMENAQEYTVSELLENLSKRQKAQDEAQDTAIEQQEQQAARPDADAQKVYVAGHEFNYTDPKGNMKTVARGSRIVPIETVQAGADPNTMVQVAITKPGSSTSAPGVMVLSEFQDMVERGYIAAEEQTEADTAADVQTDAEGKPVAEEDALPQEEAAEESAKNDTIYYDEQNNPVDADGKLIVETIESIDELTDEDFENPTRNVQLPPLPKNVSQAIGSNGKPVVIKKNIFEKNRDFHPEFDAEDGRSILTRALYNPDIVGNNHPKTRPYYRVVIQTGDKNAVVVLDVYENKDNTEIVGWRETNAKGLERLKKQAEQEDGQLLILSPEKESGSAAALSALPSDLSSTDKGTEVSEEKQVRLPENPVQTEYESLFEQTGGDESSVIQLANQMVANKQSELEQAKKSKPKGKTKEELLSSILANKEKVAALETEVQFWKDVAAFPERKRQAEEATRKLQKRIDAQQRAEQARRNNPMRLRLMDRENALGEPLSLEEYVLRRIATGATKFLWDGTSQGTGGLREHGGGRKFMLQYVDKNLGKVPEVVADDMEQDIRDNYPEFGNVTASDILDVIEGIGVGEQSFSDLMTRAEELHNKPADDEARYNEEAREAYDEAEREESAREEAAAELARQSVESLSDEEYEALSRPEFVGEMFNVDGTPKMSAPTVKEAEGIEMSFEEAIEALGDIEDEWNERILDYIYEHYPTQATVSAATNSEQGLREREAMNKDERLKQLRAEMKAAVGKAKAEMDEAWRSEPDNKEWLREHRLLDTEEVPFQRTDGADMSPIATERQAKAIARQLKKLGLKGNVRIVDGVAELVAEARKSVQKKSALETALPEEESSFKGTVVSSTDGAKILKNLETIATEYERKSEKNTKTFIGDVAKALASPNKGMSSQYKTFEAKNGNIVTIRLSDHNSKVSNFDGVGEDNVLSIVVSRKPNKGILNDGSAHVVEYFYSDRALRSAEGKPLAAIIRSIEQALYSGEYKDTTGLAHVEEVNGAEEIRLQSVFHGSGADFEAFDFSRMGSGEGNQAYGWGGYVTEVEGIGRTYAEQVTRNGKSLYAHAGNTADYTKLSEPQLRRLEEFIEKTISSYNQLPQGVSIGVDLRSGKAVLDKNGDSRAALLNYFKNIKPESIIQAFSNIDERLSGNASEKGIFDARNDIDNRFEDFLELVEEGLNIRLEQFVNEDRIKDFMVSLFLRNLYHVEIPTEQDGNYLRWEDEVSEQTRDKVLDGLKQMENDAIDADYFTEQIEKYEADYNLDGEALYKILSRFAFRSDEAASKFLSSLGFAGVSYPAEYQSGGRKDNARNYVIFKESDMKITDHIRYEQDGNGGIAGATLPNGDVLLNRGAMRIDTPFHEFAHKLFTYAKDNRGASRLYDAIRRYAQAAPQSVKDYVSAHYPGLSEDAYLDEVFAWALSKQSEGGLEAFLKARGMDMDDAARTWYERVWDAVKALWAEIRPMVSGLLGRDFADLSVFDAYEEMGAEETGAALYDLMMGGKRLPGETEVQGDEGVRYRMAQPTAEDRTLSEEERGIVERAKADGTYLKAPNGKPTNLTPKQWLQVRTKAFKDWFGDWELPTKAVSIVNAIANHGFKNFDEARAWAKKNIAGIVKHSEIGDINISNTSIEKYLSEKAVDKSDNKDVHLSALRVLPSVIEKSVVGEIHADKKGDTNIKDVVRLFGCLQLNGKLYRVKTTVKRYSDSRNIDKAYSYEITKIELLEGSGTPHTQSADFAPTSNNSISAAKLLQGVKKSNSNEEILNASKVVDENGEPLVVYHGTTSDQETRVWNEKNRTYDTDRKPFTVFKRMVDGEKNSGFFFSNNQDNAGGYGYNTYDTYLNLRNPLVIDAKGANYTDVEHNGTRQDTYAWAEYAEKNRFDGVVFKNISDGVDFGALAKTNTDYVAFSPSQIKSATDNVGTFDTENADIRFRFVGELFDADGKPKMDVDSARDKAYSKAVESGDMETAHRMLAEEAERKGYSPESDYQGSSAYNGAAPSRNTYYETREEEVEALENGEHDGDISLDMAFSHPDITALGELTNDQMLSYHRRRGDKAEVESIEAIRKAREAYERGDKEVTIKMYRSVPSIVEEKSFRNGDWVTPSLTYAKENAEIHSGYEGEEYAASWDENGTGNIIEMEVPITDVWWDENDINEWGYDDGKGYIYKNTPNNRKFYEPTYDENGKLIPLSKRFDERNADARFRFIGEKGAANLDKAEEATTRLDNLAVAREMEEAGKDAKVVKMATGWERGADEKWRYETDDNLEGVQFKTQEELIEEHRSARKEADNAGNKWNTFSNYNPALHYRASKKNSPEENERLRTERAASQKKERELFAEYMRLDEIAIKLRKRVDDGLQGVPLAEVIGENNSLLKAYPEMNKIKVSFYTRGRYLGSKGLNGSYQPEYNSIFIATDSTKEKMRSTLGHELQHAIQHIEGFSRGSNVSDLEAQKAYKEKQINLIESKIKKLERQLPGLDEEWTEKHDKIEEEINSLEDRKLNLSNIDRSFLAYKHVSGEVEARNVQSRINMTPEERRNSLAAETEDVAREEQIFLNDALGTSAALEAQPVPSPSSVSGKAKREAAEALSKKLGVPVVIEDKTTPKGRSRRFGDAKGWFVLPNAKNPNGVIHVNVDNHADVEDVERTIAHEVVAHMGMRKMLGAERYNALLDKVYDAMNEAARAYFEDYARGEFSRKEGMTDEEYRAELQRIAADEYIAALAEVGTDPTTWQKVVALVREALRALGFNLSLSDADIRALLYESKHNLESSAYAAQRDMFRQRQEEFRAAAELDRRIVEDEREDARMRRNLSGTEYDKRMGVIGLTPEGATKRQKRHNLATLWGKKLLDSSMPVKNLTNHLKQTNGGKVYSDTDLWSRKTTIPSKVMHGIDRFKKNIGNPLSNTLRDIYRATRKQQKELGIPAKKKNGTYYIGMYLMAKHMPERNAWMLADRLLGKTIEDISQKLFNMTGGRGAMSDKDMNELRRDVMNRFGSNYNDALSESSIQELTRKIHSLIEKRNSERLEKEKDRAEKKGIEAPVNSMHPLTEEDMGRVAGKAYAALNGRIEKLTDEDKDFAGATAFVERFGMKPEEYVEMFEAMMRKNGLENELDKMWDLINQATNETLRERLESGLLSREAYDNIMARGWKNYVPLRSWDERNEESADYFEIEYPERIDNNSTVFTDPTIKAEGRHSLADNPLPYIFRDAETAIRKGEENRFFQAVAKLRDDNANFTYIFGNAAFLEGKETAKEKNSHLVPYYNNGVKTNVVFVNPQLAAAVRGDTESAFGKVWRSAALNWIPPVTRFMSAMLTSMNPAFAALNLMRDLGLATLSRFVEAPDPLRGTMDAALFLYEWFRNMPAAIQASAKPGSIYTNNGRNTKLIRAWKENGGETGWHTLNDLRQTKDKLYKDITKSGVQKSLENVAYAIPGAFRFFTEVSENSVRLAAFADAKRRGLDDQAAAFYSKEITTNFNRHSNLSSAVNPLFMFFNASTQGINRILQLMKENPGNFGVAAVGMMMAGFVGAIANAAGGGDDDDYLHRSFYVRANNLVIGKWTIPLAHGFRMFYGLGAAYADYIMGNASEAEMFYNMLGTVGNELMPGPLNVTDLAAYNSVEDRINWLGQEGVGGYIRNLVPSSVLPFYDIYRNRDFMGGTISQEPFAGTESKYTPRVARSKKNVNPYLEALNQKWAGLWGFDPELDSEIAWDDKKGRPTRYPAVSASDIEYIIGQYAGGTGEFVNDMVKLGTKIGKGEDFTKADVPVLKKLYRPTDPENAIIGDYYTIKEYADVLQMKLDESWKQAETDPNLSKRARKKAVDRIRNLSIDQAKSQLKAFGEYEEKVAELYRLERQGSPESFLKPKRIWLMKQAASLKAAMLQELEPKQGERYTRIMDIKDNDLRGLAAFWDFMEKTYGGKAANE